MKEINMHLYHNCSAQLKQDIIDKVEDVKYFSFGHPHDTFYIGMTLTRHLKNNLWSIE